MFQELNVGIPTDISQEISRSRIHSGNRHGEFTWNLFADLSKDSRYFRL